MWPAKNEGEDARLYEAVEAVSDFACDLGINIPTGKDSLSMTQKYGKDVVYAPGTVIISSVGEVSDIRKTVRPVLVNDTATEILYIDLSKDNFNLGGSSFAQLVNYLGAETPSVTDTPYFAKAFNTIQQLIREDLILAGHDISAGGMITALLEMTFGRNDVGMEIDLSGIDEKETVKVFFSENPGLIIQIKNRKAKEILNQNEIAFKEIGNVINQRVLNIKHHDYQSALNINHLRDLWFKTSYLFDRKQCGENLALERFNNYKKLELDFVFPKHFTGKASQYNIELSRRKPSGIKAAIMREKGVNGDREMAYIMHLSRIRCKRCSHDRPNCRPRNIGRC